VQVGGEHTPADDVEVDYSMIDYTRSTALSEDVE
jgi:hypothetical protein